MSYLKFSLWSLILFWIVSVSLFLIGWLRAECVHRRQAEPQAAPEITPEGP